ncbi:hypothetical protein B296_00007211 [Ensete ventricosum]|uniref:Uncharacterized protein n=1 Tax=Ensete ventricosum TaxID=4639 RepID=A0A426YL59_ENSVE|nr:hypothetical protein B296_00007211 [Ensete ventricosum]
MGHPYLRSLLRLLLTMPSYFVVAFVVLAMRCAVYLLPLGKIDLVLPYLCQIGHMTTYPPMLVSDRAQSCRVNHVIDPTIRRYRNVRSDVDFLCPVRVAGGEQRPLRTQTAAPPHGLLYHRRRIRQPGSRLAPASRMRVGYSVPVIADDQTPSDHSLKGQWTAGSIPDRIKVGVRQQQCATSSPDAYFWRLRSQCRTRYVVPPGHVSELVKGFRLILKRLTFKEPQ